ncbi:hypothetical protein OKW34_002871 [Paraburkholderia youngii]
MSSRNTDARLLVSVSKSAASNCVSVCRIDLDHADAVSAFGNVARVFGEMGAQIGHARGSPFIEQRAHAAEIFEPQRHRREFEHSGVVVDGRGAAREGIQHEVLGIGSAAILDRLAPAENERRLACRFCADVPGE